VPPPESTKPVPLAVGLAAPAKLADNATTGPQRGVFRCPVSLPTCHRYLNARRDFAARRTAYQLRGTATRRTWLVQDPPG
jgi:hypothetical protein